MTVSRAARHQALWFPLAGACLAVLYRIPPSESSFYPPCPIHQVTGLLCPGCGTTRALYALLHGRFHQAFDLNALLVVVVLPSLVLYLSVSFRRGHRLPIGTPAIAAAIVLTAIFTIVRNLT